MKAPRFWMVVPTLLVAGAVGLAYAKLPAQPVDPAKAEAAKAAAAEAAKKARAAEEKAMDRVVARYKREKGGMTAASSSAPKKSKK